MREERRAGIDPGGRGCHDACLLPLLASGPEPATDGLDGSSKGPGVSRASSATLYLKLTGVGGGRLTSCHCQGRAALSKPAARTHGERAPLPLFLCTDRIIHPRPAQTGDGGGGDSGARDPLPDLHTGLALEPPGKARMAGGGAGGGARSSTRKARRRLGSGRRAALPRGPRLSPRSDPAVHVPRESRAHTHTQERTQFRTQTPAGGSPPAFPAPARKTQKPSRPRAPRRVTRAARDLGRAPPEGAWFEGVACGLRQSVSRQAASAGPRPCG